MCAPAEVLARREGVAWTREGVCRPPQADKPSWFMGAPHGLAASYDQEEFEEKERMDEVQKHLVQELRESREEAG